MDLALWTEELNLLLLPLLLSLWQDCWLRIARLQYGRTFAGCVLESGIRAALRICSSRRLTVTLQLKHSPHCTRCTVDYRPTFARPLLHLQPYPPAFPHFDDPTTPKKELGIPGTFFWSFVTTTFTTLPHNGRTYGIHTTALLRRLRERHGRNDRRRTRHLLREIRPALEPSNTATSKRFRCQHIIGGTRHSCQPYCCRCIVSAVRRRHYCP